MSEILPEPNPEQEATPLPQPDAAEPVRADVVEAAPARRTSGGIKAVVFGVMLGALIAGAVFVAAPALRAALPASLAGLMQPPVSPATEARLAQLEARLASQDVHLKALEGRAAGPGNVVMPPEVEAKLSQLDAAFAALKSEQHVAAQAQAAPKATNAVAMVVALDSLNQRIEHDAPLAVPLKILSDLAVDPAKLALFAPYADKGLPNSRTLGEAFAALAPTLLPVDSAAPTGFFDRMWVNAKKLVKIRARSELAATDPAALVQRMGLALAQGRWQEVLDSGAQLPPQAQDKARDFLRLVQARRDGEQTAQALLDQALAAVVQPKN